MPQRQTRLSTLAEIKVLSLETLKNFVDGEGEGQVGSLDDALEDMANQISSNNITLNKDRVYSSPFKTVGIARQIRVDEDYGTQNLYAIGSPTRPRIIPNNFTATVTCERIQLDRRNLYDFMSTPEYFYSPAAQTKTGILDAVYYTYLFVKNKEETIVGNGIYDIYALMPRTSTKSVSNGDVMISHNVTLTGFKVNYGENSLSAYLSSVADDITEEITIEPPSENEIPPNAS